MPLHAVVMTTICESRGFWDTVATMTVQQNIERLRQLHLVPHGDEDGLSYDLWSAGLPLALAHFFRITAYGPLGSAVAPR